MIVMITAITPSLNASSRCESMLPPSAPAASAVGSGEASFIERRLIG